MPKINRIRIINFAYNNENREIQDETYKFYDGENALLNLSNGGGKSVLVQLILQPILPDFKIQKRQMIDYFGHNRTPVFVLIEWILDNKSKKDYLMTGIAMAPGGEHNEDSNRIHYFTFASHYDAACNFDIEYVPFAKKEDERLIILPFERARESVRKMAANQREIFYYSKDDAGEYRKLLFQFGISQDEWRNIIAKMNNDEGGIDELFERCATSDSVLNEWILKTVEKAVIEEQSHDTQIRDLLAGLVSDTLKNEAYIQDQQIMKAYFTMHTKLEELLGKVCLSLENSLNARNDLGSMYRQLNQQMKTYQSDLNEIQFQKQELRDAQILIVKEETSGRYYENQEIYEEAKDDCEDKRKNLKEQKNLLETTKNDIQIQRAAKLYSTAEELKAVIAAILLKLEQVSGNTDMSRRLDNLKYSLKVNYEQMVKKSSTQLESMLKELAQGETQEHKLLKEMGDLTTEINETNNSIGGLTQSIKAFEKYEEGVFNILDISFPRNVLRQLNEKDIQNAQTAFEKMQTDTQNQFQDLESTLQQLNERSVTINSDKLKFSLEKAGFFEKITRLQQEKAEFLKSEESCKKILYKYDIEEELLYDKPSLMKVLRQRENQIEKNKYVLVLERNQILQMIEGIQNNRIYLPEVILQELNKRDIDYISGEAYLNNLDEGNRQQLLEKNPLLPFSIIIRKQDTAAFLKIDLSTLFLRQIIPVFSYEQVNHDSPCDNQVLHFADQMSIISVYEKKLFSESNKSVYLEGLTNQEISLKDRITHNEEELFNMRKAGHILESFSYERGYYDKILHNLQECKSEYDKCIQSIQALESELLGNVEKQKSTQAGIKECEQNLLIVAQKIQTLEEYLKRDAAFTEDVNRYTISIEKLKIAQKKQQINLEKQSELRENSRTLEREKSEESHRHVIYKQQLQLFSHVEEADFIPESVEYLQKEYDELSQQVEKSVITLEEERKKNDKQLSEVIEELSAMELEESFYVTISYNKEKLKLLEKGLKILEEELEKKRSILSRAEKKLYKAELEFQSVVKQLEELGLTAPLLREMIQQDYENRRTKIKLEFEELDEKKDKIAGRIQEYGNLTGRIKDIVNIQEVVYKSCTLEKDASSQFENLKNTYKALQHEFQKEGKTFRTIYAHAKAEYYGRHQSITDILDSLQYLDLENREITYESLYFHVEEFIKKRENLNKLLDFYEIQLENITHTKRQIVDQCMSYANLIYEDIKLIVQKSKIKLSEKNRAVQMLKIEVPDSIDGQARNRMEEHIDISLQSMVALSRSEQEPDNRKYQTRINSLMSGRELLNQLIGTNKIPVHVYKVDLNTENSGMKKWEAAMAQNSGGEKFVVFFTMISTLISYTRDVQGRMSGVDAMEESKVILMDNPFARTSSEHLLKAVIDIAKTFHIQLICLSDLSQSSITNRFALIYQLAIRKRLYSNKELLKIGGVQINKEGLRENERLEHVGLYQQYDQGNLFDWL